MSKVTFKGMRLLPAAFFALAVSACHAPEDGSGPEPAPTGRDNPYPDARDPESWKVQPSRDTLYFAGCAPDTLALDRPLSSAEGEGRFTLAHRCWTDVIGCAEVDGKLVCEVGAWVHAYSGTFRRADSLLTFAYRYEGTTPPAKSLPPGDHSGEASFRLKRADWDSLLVLQRADTGSGPWRFNMELLKVR